MLTSKPSADILTYIDIEDVELHPEHVVDLADRPDEQDAGEDAGDEVVRPVPALDARAVHAQNRLPYRQRAVVPHQHEHEYQVQDPTTRHSGVSMETRHWRGAGPLTKNRVQVSTK